MICSFSQQNLNSVILLMAKAFSCGMNLDNIFTNLIQNRKNAYEWFIYNSMKANPGKCQFIILGNTDSHTLKTGDIFTKSVLFVTLLGIIIDSKLNIKVGLSPYKIFYYLLQ